MQPGLRGVRGSSGGTLLLAPGESCARPPVQMLEHRRHPPESIELPVSEILQHRDRKQHEDVARPLVKTKRDLLEQQRAGREQYAEARGQQHEGDEDRKRNDAESEAYDDEEITTGLDQRPEPLEEHREGGSEPARRDSLLVVVVDEMHASTS